MLLMNFSNKLKLCALKPARTQSPKTFLPWLVYSPAIHSLVVGEDTNQGGLLPIPQTHSN
ncbi:hypothetical protein [Siphonobacter sp. SORGH_AS_0500]|uniref:hypothetical protein n=1 Tax=Siphonobacter sp. SORGH_AS_0500 TaxID=1864824 RepID=UPI002865B650|nr:hypothetical protein [Siphonobacter sp. SORGH_AS_0500]MDR6195698.1 hypothetical protein [Siphonobacter sp. SORGH_AS_0500]